MKIYNEGKCIVIDEYFKDAETEIRIIGDYYGYCIIINNKNYESPWVKNEATAEENFKIGYAIANKKYNLVSVSHKERLLKYFEETQEPSTARNIMGCSEDWYDSFYAIKQTFTIDEIKAMTDNEIENLIKLASNIQEALY